MRRSTSSSGACASGRPRAPGEIEERIALAAEQKELAGSFDYVVENDDRERAADECVAIVDRVLAAAATMAGR